MTMPGGYQSQQPGYQAGSYPPPAAGAHPEPPVVHLGGIVATQTQIVTPIGAWPAGDVTITVRDETMMVHKTPTWAIVLAIVGFFIVTVFSLFFLLAKEDVPTGGLRIVVTARNGQTYTEMFRVTSVGARNSLLQQIGLMQQVTDRERWRLSGTN